MPSSITARYPSICPACEASVAVGDALIGHKTTGKLVHSACENRNYDAARTQLIDDAASRIKTLRLSNYQLRTLSKALNVHVTRNGRWLEASEQRWYAAKAAIVHGTAKFEAAIALATGQAQQTVQPAAPQPAAAVIEAIKAEAKMVVDQLRMQLDKQALDFGDRLDKRMAEEIERRAASVRRIEVVAPDGEAQKVKGTPPACFETLLQLTSQRINAMMVGPAGCGKTYVAGMIAEALDLRFSSVSCSVGMSEAQLAGWLIPSGKGGQFEYVPSPFIETYEKGGVFLFDEIDSADPNTLTFVNAALANGHMFVPQRLGKAEVKRHKDCVILAAANTYGSGADMQYVGRNQLDAATLDRFRAGVVSMDYDEGVERAVSDPEVYAWGLKIRSRIRERGLQRIMSTRTLIAFSRMKQAYRWGATEWEARYFEGWTADERRAVTA